MLVDKFYETYDFILAYHYDFADKSLAYRWISLSIFAVLAPFIVIILWIPGFLEIYGRELIGFYQYLPSGFAGKRREF